METTIPTGSTSSGGEMEPFLEATTRALEPGNVVFQRYRLERVLGRGGMGIVWLAHDLQLEQDIALKMVPDMMVHDPEAIADLKRETKRSLKLNHHNIVRIFDFVRDQVRAGITMEFVEGRTLSEIKAHSDDGHLDVDDLQPWIGQLCDALTYAHTTARIVHYDLKPANLMLTGAGQLKVADFGISRSIAENYSRATHHRGPSGTPIYMSPQQSLGELATPLDDIYAVGATLFDLLTGKPPFYLGNIQHQLVHVVPPSVAERRRELDRRGRPVPPEWEATIAACLEKDPARRPQSAADIKARLIGPAPIPAPAAAAAPAPAALLPATATSPPPVAAAPIPLAPGAAALPATAPPPPAAPPAPPAPRSAPLIEPGTRLPPPDDPLERTFHIRWSIAVGLVTLLAFYAGMAAWLQPIDRTADAMPVPSESAAVPSASPAPAPEPAAASASDPSASPSPAPDPPPPLPEKERARIKVDTIPSGALASIGQHSAKTPALLEDVALGPDAAIVDSGAGPRWTGRRVLRLEKPGFQPLDHEIVLHSGETADAGVLQLIRNTGTVNVRSTEPRTNMTARLTLLQSDVIEEPTGAAVLPTGPGTFGEVPTGLYELRVRQDGFEDIVHQVRVRPNSVETITVAVNEAVPLSPEDTAASSEIAEASDSDDEPDPQGGARWWTGDANRDNRIRRFLRNPSGYGARGTREDKEAAAEMRRILGRYAEGGRIAPSDEQRLHALIVEVDTRKNLKGVNRAKDKVENFFKKLF